ncbi:MAG TPA: DUF4136 domain-containing protein [Polyangiaceae bacterium]|nr:DUF4136 domain-containing protein [Polyangiaceae bacterium]
MKLRSLLKWSIVSAALTVLACSYESLTAAETDVVLTIRDDGRDYSAYRTYALSTEVVDLCGLVDPDNGLDPLPIGGAGGVGGRTGFDDDDNCIEINHDQDAVIIDEVAKQMDAYGYTKVDSVADDPDVVVLLGVVARNNWQYQPAYPWCDPYYYYWCWYPSTGYVYNLPTAAVLINMIDAQETATDDLQSVWFAALQGLFQTDSTVSTEQRIRAGIGQAFTQSSYLKLQGAE